MPSVCNSQEPTTAQASTRVSSHDNLHSDPKQLRALARRTSHSSISLQASIADNSDRSQTPSAAAVAAAAPPSLLFSADVVNSSSGTTAAARWAWPPRVSSDYYFYHLLRERAREQEHEEEEKKEEKKQKATVAATTRSVAAEEGGILRSPRFLSSTSLPSDKGVEAQLSLPRTAAAQDSSKSIVGKGGMVSPASSAAVIASATGDGAATPHERRKRVARKNRQQQQRQQQDQQLRDENACDKEGGSVTTTTTTDAAASGGNLPSPASSSPPPRLPHKQKRASSADARRRIREEEKKERDEHRRQQTAFRVAQSPSTPCVPTTTTSQAPLTIERSPQLTQESSQLTQDMREGDKMKERSTREKRKMMGSSGRSSSSERRCTPSRHAPEPPAQDHSDRYNGQSGMSGSLREGSERRSPRSATAPAVKATQVPCSEPPQESLSYKTDRTPSSPRQVTSALLKDADEPRRGEDGHIRTPPLSPPQPNYANEWKEACMELKELLKRKSADLGTRLAEIAALTAKLADSEQRMRSLTLDRASGSGSGGGGHTTRPRVEEGMEDLKGIQSQEQMQPQQKGYHNGGEGTLEGTCGPCMKTHATHSAGGNLTSTGTASAALAEELVKARQCLHALQEQTDRERDRLLAQRQVLATEVIALRRHSSQEVRVLAAKAVEDLDILHDATVRGMAEYHDAFLRERAKALEERRRTPGQRQGYAPHWHSHRHAALVYEDDDESDTPFSLPPSGAVAMLRLSFCGAGKNLQQGDLQVLDARLTVDESQGRLIFSESSLNGKGHEWEVYHPATQTVIVVQATLESSADSSSLQKQAQRAASISCARQRLGSEYEIGDGKGPVCSSRNSCSASTRSQSSGAPDGLCHPCSRTPSRYQGRSIHVSEADSIVMPTPRRRLLSPGARTCTSPRCGPGGNSPRTRLDSTTMPSAYRDTATSRLRRQSAERKRREWEIAMARERQRARAYVDGDW